MKPDKRVTVCGDDFALDESVSSAVLQLAANGRISAVSCLADAPLWKDAGKDLRKQREKVLTGLHFNLTESFGKTTPMPLRKMILLSLTRRIKASYVRSRLERQIDRFVDVMGAPPDFIDGHEHVHAFPIIAAEVRRVAEAIGPDAPIPIRSVEKLFGPTDAPIKRAAIFGLAALGARDARELRYNRLNSTFAGDYSMKPSADFERLFRIWIETAPDRALIMCHPRCNTRTESNSDVAKEFQFLDSAVYGRLLDSNSGLRFLRRDELIEGFQSRPDSFTREPPRSTQVGSRH